jgi:alginate O-acetyltransferase complex protein AlgI
MVIGLYRACVFGCRWGETKLSNSPLSMDPVWVNHLKFNSIQFLLFFPLVATAFFVIPHRVRWFLLLGASYIFYISWNPKYVVVLLTVTVIGYLSGLLLESEDRQTRRRIILIFSLLASLGILLFFKYFELSSRALHVFFEQLGISHLIPGFNILLPLGISFFTFQTMSYILDVYRGIIPAEKHVGMYALFIAFFPHLTAGPIARAKQLLPQFHTVHAPDYEMIVSGLQRMVWGLFKKLVIADRLALLVNTVYGDPTAFTGTALIIATYAFAFQIYCDFSGYADIAIGAARVMGFELQENFQRPYSAHSIPDFWRRWHITLYNWLRDYIFYPLSRVLRRSRLNSDNLLVLALPPMLTMLASGLWHGTDWTFIIWGALHGVFMVSSVLWNRRNNSLQLPFSLHPQVANGIRIFATFNLVCFAWIFFRANSLSDAVYIIQHLFTNLEINTSLFALVPGGWYDWLVALLAILTMEAVQWIQRKNGSLRGVIRRQPVWLRWSLYYGLVIAIFIFGKFGAGEFIYARF